MTLAWISVDAKTGGVLADLPDLDVPKVSRSICRYDSTTATLPVPTAPEGWELATRPGGAVMILLDSDAPNPLWGGMVNQRTRGSGDILSLSLATEESYFDGRFVGDETYVGIGQNAIVADLFSKYVSVGPLGGIPIRVEQVGGAGTLRDRTYTDDSDKSIYSVLTELAALTDGIQYSVEWERTIVAGKPIYTPVLYVGSRIGTPVMAGMAPSATFDLPGCVTEASYAEDFSGGRGANSVVAVSTATGNVRPQSPPQLAADDGRPTREYRFTPSTDITITDTLTDHASKALAALATGANALTLSAAVAAAPKLGTDWILGDDVGYQIGGLEADPRARWTPGFSDLFSDIFTDMFGTYTGMDKTLVNPNGRPSVPAFPNGLSGVARCVSWELSFGTPEAPKIIVTPTLESETING